MDLTKIIYPDWVARPPTPNAPPTTISTEEQLRNACVTNGANVIIDAGPNNIVSLDSALRVTGSNIRVSGPDHRGTPFIRGDVKFDGAQRVEFSGISFDPGQPQNDKMIAVRLNRCTDITFTDCYADQYGRIGYRLEGHNTHITWDGGLIDGGGSNIYHGIGVSDDGPNSKIVLYDVEIRNNGAIKGKPEYGFDGHLLDGILAFCNIHDNGRGVKFPGTDNLWMYGCDLREGEHGDYAAIHIYKDNVRAPGSLYFFNNRIWAQPGHHHLSFQNGARVAWVNNRTFDLGSDTPVAERIRNAGGTLVRNDAQVSDFMLRLGAGQPDPPQPPPIIDTGDDNGELPEVAIETLINEVTARVLARLDVGAIAERAAELVELPDGLVDAVAEVAVKKIGESLVSLVK